MTNVLFLNALSVSTSSFDDEGYVRKTDQMKNDAQCECLPPNIKESA